MKKGSPDLMMTERTSKRARPQCLCVQERVNMERQLIYSCVCVRIKKRDICKEETDFSVFASVQIAAD